MCIGRKGRETKQLPWQLDLYSDCSGVCTELIFIIFVSTREGRYYNIQEDQISKLDLKNDIPTNST